MLTPIKCTYGDIDRFRGGNDQPSLYQKLWNHVFPLSLDGHRTRKFCKTLSPVINEYEEELLKLGSKYGTEEANKSFKVPPEKLKDFLEAKKSLDAVECAVTLVPLPFSTWSQVPLSAANQDALEKFVEAAPEEPEE